MQNPVGFATARASLHCKLTGIARQACLRNAPAGAVTVPELKYALFTTSQNTFLEPFETILTLLLIFFICRIFLSSPISPFPPQTKNIPVPCRFHPAKGTGMLFTDSNPISNHAASSRLTGNGGLAINPMDNLLGALGNTGAAGGALGVIDNSNIVD